MLATSLGRYVDHRTLQQFQQTLLHTLARNVARDARVLRFAGNLVDLIDEDDTLLGFRNVVLAVL